MGDPCCVWSIGQKTIFTTSATSKTTRQISTCVQTNVLKQTLQCSVCTQALQLEMKKPSVNAADFSLISVKSCKDSTQDAQQQLLCVKTLVENADQLFKEQKNGVSPIQSCMNLGLNCIPLPTTQVPPLPPIIIY